MRAVSKKTLMIAGMVSVFALGVGSASVYAQMKMHGHSSSGCHCNMMKLICRCYMARTQLNLKLKSLRRCSEIIQTLLEVSSYFQMALKRSRKQTTRSLLLS